MTDSEDTPRRDAEVAGRKAADLEALAQDYLEARKTIPDAESERDRIAAQRDRIREALGATEAQWNDWRWQIRNRIDDLEVLERVIEVSEEERRAIREVEATFRWSVSPHFAALMHPEDARCPIRKQVLPDRREANMEGVADFSGEEYNSPVRNMVRWYPDRVAVHITNQCAAYCRHCLRRRKIGEVDRPTPQDNLDEIFAFLREHEEIRDVLFTGGDPLTFSTDRLDALLSELDAIEHVEIKRIGSRIPLTVPQRVDDELCEMLSRHHPLYINIQANHPLEVSEETVQACDKLSRAGIPLGNQTVLMRGVNDDPHVARRLSHVLLKARVRPYYLYHCQGTVGITHLRTPVETGVEIIENMRGHTSGLGIPRYIITPPGYGKTPMAPNYHVSSGEGFLKLRNWEGLVYEYENPR